MMIVDSVWGPCQECLIWSPPGQLYVTIINLFLLSYGILYAAFCRWPTDKYITCYLSNFIKPADTCDRRKKFKPRGQRQKELEETLKKWKRSCLGSLRVNQIGHWNNFFRKQINLRYAIKGKQQFYATIVDEINIKVELLHHASEGYYQSLLLVRL